MFISIAFIGAFPLAQVGFLILGQYVIKLVVTAASIPLIYLVRAKVEIDRPDSA